MMANKNFLVDQQFYRQRVPTWDYKNFDVISDGAYDQAALQAVGSSDHASR